MDAQKIAQRLYESFASDDLCEHPEIVDGVEDLADEYEDLKAENAKLRELLVDAVEVADAYYSCGGVKDDLDTIKDEMRELGIEG